MVSAQNIRKSYGKIIALDGAGFELKKGQRLCLIGPSGSGKSTLLRMVNAMETPDAGTVRVFGQPVESFDPVELRRKIGYVLQSPALFPHFTIIQNVALGLKLGGVKKTQRTRSAKEFLHTVGLAPGDMEGRFPRELSGGQQQRVAIARALATNPELMLFDEPFSALDPLTRSELQEEVLRLSDTLNKTVLFVTHDMREAVLLGQEIAVLNKGCVVQTGGPEDILNRPVNDFVKRFIATAHVG